MTERRPIDAHPVTIDEALWQIRSHLEHARQQINEAEKALQWTRGQLNVPSLLPHLLEEHKRRIAVSAGTACSRHMRGALTPPFMD